MNTHEAETVLAGFSEFEIETLACGRISRAAMREALSRICEQPVGIDVHRKTDLCCVALAEALNDMMEAARITIEKRDKQ